MRITTTMKRRTSGLIMLGIGLTLAVPATAQMPQTAAAAAAFLVAAAAAAAAGDYDEVPRDRSAKDILPAGVLKGAFYRVRDVVPTDGYTDQWKVDSDFGPFEVDGDGALRKLIGEIHAISELKKVSKTEAFAKGLGGATIPSPRSPGCPRVPTRSWETPRPRRRRRGIRARTRRSPRC